MPAGVRAADAAFEGGNVAVDTGCNTGCGDLHRRRRRRHVRADRHDADGVRRPAGQQVEQPVLAVLTGTATVAIDGRCPDADERRQRARARRARRGPTDDGGGQTRRPDRGPRLTRAAASRQADRTPRCRCSRRPPPGVKARPPSPPAAAGRSRRLADGRRGRCRRARRRASSACSSASPRRRRRRLDARRRSAPSAGGVGGASGGLLPVRAVVDARRPVGRDDQRRPRQPAGPSAPACRARPPTARS